MDTRLNKRDKLVSKTKTSALVISLALVAGLAVAKSEVKATSLNNGHVSNGKPAYPPIEPKETKPLIDIIWGKITA
ncbi:hypothetical protein BGP78_10355 [Pseudoalteromonas sp. MSK9-3]|uniref:hypothetical protein n=1 Tax=Pseudoalteromonas sp. MSK9-3 TaxID=1897633 RepID=UPI000E6D2BE4|nr:hypothetical protein [Pseudoalteromonas sp. MSK9-3]RJE76804.1 hypothetical protein BGP78_10355 [Pseudoalteromonas sp. MSK9-3]